MKEGKKEDKDGIFMRREREGWVEKRDEKGLSV